MKRLLAVLIMLLASVSLLGGQAEDFREATSRYDQGDFAASAEMFQSIIDRGYSSAELFYNAGCAYYKAGNLGRAIANFRRAQRLSPDDEEIRTNLQFAQLYAVDKIEQSSQEQLIDKLVNWLSALTPNQYFATSLVAITAFFGFLALRRKGALARVGGWPAVLLVLVAMLSVAAMTAVIRSNHLLDEGVIVAAQTEVLSGPGSEFELQFEAHEGLLFKILEARDEYYLGLFANKLKGWVRKSAVEQI